MTLLQSSLLLGDAHRKGVPRVKGRGKGHNPSHSLTAYTPSSCVCPNKRDSRGRVRSWQVKLVKLNGTLANSNVQWGVNSDGNPITKLMVSCADTSKLPLTYK